MVTEALRTLMAMTASLTLRTARGLHQVPKRLILLNRWPFVPNDLDTLVFRSSEQGYCC